MSQYYKGIFYRCYGNSGKPAVLFIHGFMGDGSDWSDVIERVSVNHYCITIDLPGHGKSVDTPLLKDNPGFASLSKGIDHLLSHLSISRTHVVGYSMGGRIAQHFVIDFPEKVIKVVLESSSFGIKNNPERTSRLEADIKLAEKIKNESFSNFLEDWYKQELFSGIQQNPKYPGMLKKRYTNNPLLLSKVLVNYSTGWQHYMAPDILAKKTPLMLICGEKDIKYLHNMQSTKEKNPHIILKIIKSAGHNTHFEKPNLFAEHLVEFLSL